MLHEYIKKPRTLAQGFKFVYKKLLYTQLPPVIEVVERWIICACFHYGGKCTPKIEINKLFVDLTER